MREVGPAAAQSRYRCAVSVNNPRAWAAAVALGFALAGPQAFGTASA